MDPRFVLDKKVLFEKVKELEDLGLKISYSYKTNRLVGDILQKEFSNIDFSIHAKEEVDMIKDKSKISFFTQAESVDELGILLDKGIRNFVVDNELDLERILSVISKKNIKIVLSLRMKFQEHRVGTGKYFVYGLPSKRVNEIILDLKGNKNISSLGVHIHRKSQNTSEWEIVGELKDSLSEEVLEIIDFINLGGGVPSIYRSSSSKVFEYVFQKLKETREWLDKKGIVAIIEPGRFLAAACINLEVEIIQKYEGNLIVNTTIYNCALDSILTGTKMLVEGEIEENKDNYCDYLIKGNSPTRDDIFRYKVRLPKKLDVGDKIVFLNAGAYNYTTDFFGYKKLETVIL